MRAMLLEKVGGPLILREIPRPTPKQFEVLVRVRTCGVCRTDLHIVDGELASPTFPLILGHQVVGEVESLGPGASKLMKGQRVGIPWLGRTCHSCEYCLKNQENLCDHPTFTGYSCNGGYAEYCIVHEDYTVLLPDSYKDEEAAPLLCAGLIGYRAFNHALPFTDVGFYGFGSSAHILIQLAKSLGKRVYVFTKPNDLKTQTFARSLGAVWAGSSTDQPPAKLDAAIIFAPVGALYVAALKSLKKGGRVVSAGIHMSEIPAFGYDLLWEERIMTSVANLTRQDAKEFMRLAHTYPINISTVSYSLEKANEALDVIRKGGVDGSVVLKI